VATEISSVRCGMPDKLGSRLRQVREQRRIALAAIARDTKIGLPLLEGLERDDVSHWPSGIFRRSFIRAYAQALGLEPDSVVTEFLEQFPDPSEVVGPESIIAARAAAPSAQQRPPTRLGVLWKAAVRYRDAWNLQIVGPLRSAVARVRGARLSAVPGSRLLSFISKPRPASALQCAPSFDGSSPITASRAPTSPKPPLVIKVIIASNQSSFARGKVIRDLRCRWAAAACDAGMLMFVAVAMFLILNNFWSSFAISAVCYYLASVVILGNTPGICLCAPLDRAKRGVVPAQSG
jgi:transcriptional regulator with XRE-family HTH domain